MWGWKNVENVPQYIISNLNVDAIVTPLFQSAPKRKSGKSGRDAAKFAVI